MAVDVRTVAGVEIRPAREEEMETFRDNLRIGFSSGPRPPRPADETEPPPDLLPEWTLCAFEDGQLATTYAAFPFEMYFHGRIVPAAGVTAVSTLPWFRRRGHLRTIMATDFARMHEEGGPAIAILYASMAAIYQRFGYAIVSTQLRYTVDPRSIEFASPEPVLGRYRRIGREEIGTVAPVFEAFARQYTGSVRRESYIWQHEIIGYYAAQPPFCITYEEQGEIQGYLFYRASQRPRGAIDFSGSVSAEAWDLTWLTPSAYRALWAYLKAIDLASEVKVYNLPPDDPGLDLFLEPRQLYPTRTDGLLARITDVERAAAQRDYAGEGRLSFEIVDAMAPWNAGRWELETDGGETRVRRGERQPELTMPVATLAPLLFGHYSASHAARIGRLSVHDSAALPRWDALLRTERPPFCGTGF